GWYPSEEMPKEVAEDFAAHPEIPVWHPEFLDGHNFSITGEKLQWSLEFDTMMDHREGIHTENYGCTFHWDVTSELINELDHNINFDLSQIQDTITITVTYLDGTTANTSVYVSCDKDGYITLSSDQ
ncbi:MAG: hypothetical protein K2F65_05490, partial [Eubacterium sp.]|nr:hypothetical protein [Eubacterium sp.]